MDSQETPSSAGDSPVDRSIANMVREEERPLAAKFQAKSQPPPAGSVRYPVNGGHVAAPRPLGQPPPTAIRYFDTVRPSLASAPASKQFVQFRSHGAPPPRPLANFFSPRDPQLGQNPATRNLPPAARLESPALGKATAQAIRPIAPSFRPPLAVNYQQQQQQIFARSNSESQQRPFLPRSAGQNVAQLRAQRPQAPENCVSPRQLQKNDSPLIARQNQLAVDQRNRQFVRPQIVVQKMTDVEESSGDLRRQNSLQRKKTEVRDSGENDDDDDVVIDNEKSARRTNSAASNNNERSSLSSASSHSDEKKSSNVNNGADEKGNESVTTSTSPQTPRKNEDALKSAARPATAVIDKQAEVKVSSVEASSEKAQESEAKMQKDDQSTTNESGREVSQSRPTSAAVADKVENVPKSASSKLAEKEEEKEEKEGKWPKDEKEKPSLNVNGIMNEGEKELVETKKVVEKKEEEKEGESKEESEMKSDANSAKSIKFASADEKKSVSPLHDDDSRKEANDATSNADKLSPSQSAKQEEKDSPSSQSSAKIEKDEKESEGRSESEKSAIDVAPQTGQEKSQTAEENETKERSSAPSIVATATENIEEDSRMPAKSPDLSASSSASRRTAVDAVEDEQSKESSEDSQLPKACDDLRREESKESSRAASALSQHSTTSTTKLPSSECPATPPRSPEEGVKGFDNGQRRSLSPQSNLLSPKSPKSPKSPTLCKTVENEERQDDNEKKDNGEQEGKLRVKTPTEVGSENEERESAPSTGIENHNEERESSRSKIELPTSNGVSDSPIKKSPSKSREGEKKATTAVSPVKSPSKSKSLPRTPETPSSTTGQEKKKVPMNKVQVGAAPSPNLKTVRSKIGSLENASYKPGGGKVKIENRKLDFSKAQPKIAAKNEKYTPSGGDKKIAQVKLQWNAKPKVGSLENATYKPGGGDKKIETVKLDFKDKAKPKVGSKENVKHVPGGGSVKSSTTPPKTSQDANDDIQTQKVEIKAESKVGSLDNVKHKPGGGDKKIFNDKDYLRQSGSNVESVSGSGSQVEQTVKENNSKEVKKAEDGDMPQPPPSTPTRGSTVKSSLSMVTPKSVQRGLSNSPDIIKKSANTKNLNKMEQNSEITEKNVASASLNSLTLQSGRSARRSKNNNKASTNRSFSRKTSPNELRLPKLIKSSSIHQEVNLVPDIHSKLTLPKLIEPSVQSSRTTH